MMRRIAVGALLSMLLLGASPAAAQEDDLPDACRTIIGCPDAGPAPENPGDRGGYAQLLTLAVIVGGVGFIAWRVTRAVRDGDRRSVAITRPDPPRSP